MAAPAKAQIKAGRDLGDRVTEDEKDALRRVLWRDRLTSLWAPVTVFGLFFVFYLFLVEFRTSNYLWAQPILKVIGLFCFIAFLGLTAVRLGLRSFSHARKTRTIARELADELSTAARKPPTPLEAKAREQLIEKCHDLTDALARGDVARLEGEVKKTNEYADKVLPVRKGSGTDFAIGFAKALFVALLIRTIVIEPFKIPSGSMIPTLEIGDQIFVNKFIYGVRIPFTNVVPFVLVREPQRGDVIVFNNPADTSKDFIKRVVGVPGDEIKVVNEVVYVSGQPQPRLLISENYTYSNQDQNQGRWFSEHASLYEENLNGAKHPTLQSRGHPRGNMTEGPWRVPPQHVFVMGDNRDNSLDSRYGLGGERGVKFVPYGNIKGKAMVIWLSLSHGGVLGSLFGETGLRTDRLFQPVR